MTNEQAKAILTEYLDMDSDVNSEYLEAIRMAVKALEQQLSEDCISRADMLDAIGHGNTYNSEELVEIIKRLPSVMTKPKSGSCVFEEVGNDNE